MLRLGLKTVPMMGTNNIVYKFNIWILHGRLIILIVNTAHGKYLNTLIILFINSTFGYFIGN